MEGVLIIGALIIFLWFEGRKSVPVIQAPTVQPLPANNVVILPSAAPPVVDSALPIHILQQPTNFDAVTPTPLPVNFVRSPMPPITVSSAPAVTSRIQNYIPLAAPVVSPDPNSTLTYDANPLPQQELIL